MDCKNEDMFRDLKVVIFISQIWGLVPRTTGNKLQKCIFFIYSISTTCFYVYVGYSFNLYFFERINQAAAHRKLLMKIIYVETSLRCILLLAILLLNLAKSGQFLLILEKLSSFDTLLKLKLNSAIPTKANFLLQLAYSVFILVIGAYYGAKLYVAKNSLQMSMQWAILSNVNLIILSQFTVFVHAFNVRFKIFNKYFTNMNIVCSFNTSKLKNYFDYNRPNASRYKNLNILSHFKLKELHIIYLSMRDLLQEINSYYSLQILLIVCETVAILMASISTFTFNIIVDDSLTKSIHRWLTLIHCALRLLSVSLLIHVVEETSNEANYTVIIIHNFLKEKPNEKIKKGLELFLLDLWHHKVKFDAHDFFDLDYHLIQSILSAATTYVIVLIQFQLATTESTKAVPGRG